jgi:hypothetical protein
MLKNFLSEFFVDEIPEGKDDEYLSLEQTAEIVKRLKSFALLWMLIKIWAIVWAIGSIVRRFADFPILGGILFNIVAYGGFIILLIFFSIKYLNLRKYAKKISEDCLRPEKH